MDSQRVDEEEKNFSSIWATFSFRLITLDVTAAIGQNLMHFLPDDDRPTRQEKADVVENPIKTSASLDSDGLDPAELRRLLWGYIKYAPSFAKPRAERVGEATAAVEPWPHQINAFERIYRQWPRKLLIAYEVGLGKQSKRGCCCGRLGWPDVPRGF
jgi:hypothetical protein